jgi:hypothetical protein
MGLWSPWLWPVGGPLALVGILKVLVMWVPGLNRAVENAFWWAMKRLSED